MSSSPSAGTGASWTMHVQTEDNGDEIETLQDMSNGSFDIGEEGERALPIQGETNSRATGTTQSRTKSRPKETGLPDDEQIKSSLSQCERASVGSAYVCQPYKVEQLERQLFTNDPGTTRRVAIIETLRTRTFL
jgi:hypothetical protein